jgi:hypothetical protein
MAFFIPLTQPENPKAVIFICLWYSPPFRDGCGKMPTVKMLSRIAEPTDSS